MKRSWTIRREVVEYEDGQGRWDRAYQLLLRWAIAAEPRQEDLDHASRILRAGLDGAPAAGADNRAADHASAGVRGQPGRLDGGGGAHLSG